MEGARQDQVVVGADLIQAAVVEGSVVDQATRLVDYDEGEDSPVSLPASFQCKPLIEMKRGRTLCQSHLIADSAEEDEIFLSV